MEEIKVGEYVRTKKGYIEKINNFIPHYTTGKRLGVSERVVENYLSMGKNQCKFIESIDYSIPPCYPSDEEWEKIKKHITKHSPNLIGLIEVGDYVNGEKVVTIDRVDSEYGIVKCLNGNHYWNYEIKTILTKEQYKENCYEVK